MSATAAENIKRNLEGLFDRYNYEQGGGGEVNHIKMTVRDFKHASAQ
jgi:hypothetical protein